MAGNNKVQYDPKNDYYRVLGVPDNASLDIIQRAYRKKAKEVHPDLNPEREAWAKAQFQLVNEAYRVLSNVESRQEYNNLRWRKSTFTSSKKASDLGWDSYYDTSTTKRDNERWRQNTKKSSYTYRPQQPQTIEHGQWLIDIGLKRLQPAYAGFINLFGSPYRYILMIITTAVILNGIFIAAALIYTGGDLTNFEQSSIFASEPTETSTPENVTSPIRTSQPNIESTLPPASQVPTATSTPLNSGCRNTAVLHVDDRFQLNDNSELKATVSGADMQTYEVIAYILGDSPTSPPVGQFFLRPQSQPGRQDDPVVDDVIVDVSEYFRLEGYYEIVLDVYSENRQVIGSCAVIIYWDPLTPTPMPESN